MMGIGKRIKDSRLKRHLSQAELAAALHISQPALSDIENEVTQTPRNLHKFAEILNVPEVWLQYGEKASRYQVIEGVNKVNRVKPSEKVEKKEVVVLAKNIPLLTWSDLPSKKSHPESLKKILDSSLMADVLTVAFKNKEIMDHTLFAIQAKKSDSMIYPYPKKGNIYGGEILVIDIEKKPQPGDLVFVRIQTDYTIRKLVKEGAKTFLQAHNLQFPVLDAKEVSVEGVIVQMINTLFEE